MRYGFVLPYGDARSVADLAAEAEGAGWDGFFVWEPIWGVDAWVALAAATMCTERIRLGTLLTPISRVRPWKLAGETATLDNLSNGRVILSVGLGAVDTGFDSFGEEIDRKTRAELLDEGLDILTGLWNGQPFSYSGKHYQITETSFFPPAPPVQQPRIPIWVVGAWRRNKSMQRVLRYDGLIPNVMDAAGKFEQTTPEHIREMRDFVTAKRTETTPFDIVTEGRTPGDDAERCAELVRPWADAGATWWIEEMWASPDAVADPAGVRKRLSQGPPRID